MIRSLVTEEILLQAVFLAEEFLSKVVFIGPSKGKSFQRRNCPLPNKCFGTYELSNAELIDELSSGHKPVTVRTKVGKFKWEIKCNFFNSNGKVIIETTHLWIQSGTAVFRRHAPVQQEVIELCAGINW